MAVVTCPRCSHHTQEAGFPLWAILVAILFYPLGLLALLAGRKPTTCTNRGYTWRA
ncbi:MAG TPA: DUF2367 domain-containing protein [Vulgatibacter sp.]|nr:DUF2367 domain-containing protein [Vulgatibacter sp.]